MKTKLFVTSVAVFGALAFSAQASDMVQIKGEACEKFVSGQSKSSIRVRVTDKASYNAVSQVPNLADVRSKMLEHDFNVIVYNLVDNYVQDLMVRTINQSDKELCVKVTGAIPVADIDKVVTNYSPNAPAPEYDIKELAGVQEEVLTTEDELESEKNKEPEAEALYNGVEEEKAVSGVEVYSENTQKWESSQKEEMTPTQEDDGQGFELGELPPPPAQQQVVAEQDAEPEEDVLSEDFPQVAPMIELPAKVYVGPVEFNNNTHSSKPSQVLKDMFAETEGYQLIDTPQKALYAFYPKVLKAKVDSLNSQTKRIQMVVSLEVQIRDSNISYSEHQNRFVLFESSEKEQEVAQKLLHKLLRKAGKKLFAKVEQTEEKRILQNAPAITPR